MERNAEAGEVMAATVEALAATAETLERTMSQLEARLEAQQAEIEGRVQKIMGTIEPADHALLEARLAEAERQIAELRAGAAAPIAPGRKTLSATTANLLAKHGVSSDGAVEAGAVDAALASLPVEQRIAVKSQLLRAGLLG
jgi:predicted RNase H-like nuclease (RuvC/YqgF family)